MLHYIPEVDLYISLKNIKSISEIYEYQTNYRFYIYYHNDKEYITILLDVKKSESKDLIECKEKTVLIRKNIVEKANTQD